MKLRKTVSIVFSLFLLVGSFSACDSSPSAVATESSRSESQAFETTAADAPSPISTQPPPAEDVALPNISWAQAFRNKSVPDGSVNADNIAFLRVNEDSSFEIVNVLKKDIYDNPPARLPRTHYFEPFMDSTLVEVLLPVIDYAMLYGYSRFCLPTTELNYGLITENARYLAQIYGFSNSGIGSLEIKSFPQEDGEALRFMLITITGMEKGDAAQQFAQGLTAAEAIVDAMPDGLDELGKMLYLYEYLTKNVRYDFEDYYGSAYCLLYDTLVLHNTVCAGYAEALYVLANLAGIECFQINGVINDISGAGYHVWNIARINGQYYQFDATWDEGLSPVDYRFFGASDDYMMENHTQYITQFALDYSPPCPESIWPAAIYPGTPGDEDYIGDIEYIIVWYYRLRNAIDYNPNQFLNYLGFDNDEIAAQEPADGFVQTSVRLNDVFDILLEIMSTKQAALMIAGRILAEEGQGLQYHVPGEIPAQARLIGLAENEDGTWTAELLIIRGAQCTIQQEVIELMKIADDWYVVDQTTTVQSKDF